MHNKDEFETNIRVFSFAYLETVLLILLLSFAGSNMFYNDKMLWVD